MNCVYLDGFDPEITTAVEAKGDLSGLRRHCIWQRPELYITRFAAQPRWKNGGNTPTRRLRIRTNWAPFPGPPPIENYEDWPPRSATPMFIAPQAIEGSEVIDLSGAPRRLVEWSFRPIGEEPLILIWGRADYDEVFDRPHFVKWCYRLRLDCHDGKKLRAKFIQWGDYNQTDETS